MIRRYAYPAQVRKIDGDACLVSFPDLPEARTFGMSEAEAVARAPDCLREALRSRMVDQEDIPAPSAAGPGLRLVVPPTETAAKVAVYEAFRRTGLTRVALAERLGVAEAEVRRILDPNHRTKLARLDAVARVLGGRLEIAFVPDAA